MSRIVFIFLSLFLSIQAFSQHDSGTTTNQAPECLSQDPNQEVDMECIEEQLKGEGLGGWVHAAVQDQSMFVFTWRRPNNFFVNVQLPMASTDPQVLAQLDGLRRHDQIVLKGEFFQNDAPLKHINVKELKVVKAYEGPKDEYQYDPNLPEEIQNGSSVVAKVHIVANGGRVLVIETGDRVLPVFNKNPKLVEGLYRNDKIELKYKVRFIPPRPSHLEVDETANEPVRVLERIADQHGEDIELTGALVMFPQSPQIKFNVFALRQEDGDEIRRNFTIVNFENFDLFTEIREKLQDLWTQHEASAEYDRNKYINRKIQVTVRGKKNVVSPSQANPQIIPERIEDVSVEIL